MSGEDLTTAVKTLAIEAGFDRVGIAPAGPVPRGELFRRWLAGGCHASMAYMARNVEQRLRPDRFLPGARSVICLAVRYASTAPPPAAGGVVARYARGRDYHRLLKRRCRELMDAVRRLAPDFQGRAAADSAPVAERSLAAAAGLGWIGRNGCLVVPGLGSYVLLAEIVCNLPLRVDSPLVSQCRDCRACLEACPTGAIIGESLIDARRCLSYLTIEHRGEIGETLRPLMGRRIFGCDTCQEACPHNRDIPADSGQPAPAPLGGASLAEILSWQREDWDAATRGSATRRADCDTLIRNAIIAAGNSGDAALVEPLRKLRRRELATLTDWAIGRLGER